MANNRVFILITKFVFLFILAGTYGVCFSQQIDLQFSNERGFYNSSFSLSITNSGTTAQIHYTLDNSVPTTSSAVYTSPISINSTTAIRVRAYNALDTTPVITHSYLFVNEIINGPNMSTAITQHPTYGPQMEAALLAIPTVSVVTTNNIIEASEVETSMEMIFQDGNPSINENAGVKYYGNAGLNADKNSIRLYFRGQYGAKNLEYPTLFDGYESGMTPARKFDQLELRSSQDGWVQPSWGTLHVSSRFWDNTMLAMGNLNTHGRFAHLFINGEYEGQFHLRERMNDGYFAEYLGGDKLDYEAISGSGNGNLAGNWFEGAPFDGTGAMWSAYTDLATQYDHWKQVGNTNSFFDFMISWMFSEHENEYKAGGSYTDGFYYRINDADGSFFLYDNINNDRTGPNVTGPQNARGPAHMFQDLFNEGDSDFIIDFADRAECHCRNGGALTPTQTVPRMEALRQQTQTSIIADAARWISDPSRIANRESEINQVVNNYLQQKPGILINQLKNRGLFPNIDPPTFSQNGGPIPNGFNLSLSNPNGVGNIYFTVDGSDPRAEGGGLSPTAQLYTGSFSLPGTFEVKARVYSPNSSDKWSAMCPKTFYAPQNYSNLVINEIHYHPEKEIDGIFSYDGKLYEFIEIYNKGNTTIELGNIAFSYGIWYDFPLGASIAPGQYWVLAKEPTSFLDRYGFAPDGKYEGSLDDAGEQLELSDPFGNIIDVLTYDDRVPWPLGTDGLGQSIQLKNPSNDNSLPANWLAACPTPKAQNSGSCTAPNVVINEINYSSLITKNPGDWIELYNPGINTINLSNWVFRDQDDKFVVPAGTILPPNSYLVIAQDLGLFSAVFPNVTNVISGFSFGLDGGGEQIALFNNNCCLVDLVRYNDDPPWPTTPDATGPTLSLQSPGLDNNTYTSWEASTAINAPNGTPGRINGPCPTTSFPLPITYCQNESILFSISNPVEGATYIWDFQNGTPVSSTGPNVSATWQNAGFGTVQLTVYYGECEESFVEFINVVSCNQPPTAQNNSYNTNEDVTKNGNIVNNDSDPDGDNLTVSTTPIDPPNNGTLTLNANGSFTYVPNANYFGSDNFIYEVCDDGVPVLCDQATVNITISSVNDAPVAQNNTTSTIEDTPKTIFILNNDSDIDGNLVNSSLTLLSTPLGNQGTVSVNTNGSITFVPATNFSGPVNSFSYEICDNGSPVLCDQATVTISVTGVNDPPNAINDNYFGNEDLNVSGNLLLNDTDPDGNNLALISTAITPPNNGNVMLLPNGTFTYTPNANFNGSDSFTYEVCDDGVPVLCDQATAYIAIDYQNDPPIVNNDSYTINEDETFVLTPLANDSDLDGNLVPSSLTILNSPPTSEGIAVANQNGTIIFVPAFNYNGPVTTLNYQVCDDGFPIPVACSQGSIQINILAVNDNPTANPDMFTGLEEQPLLGNVLTNDLDIEGDQLSTFTQPVVNTTNGSLVLQSNGAFVYTPNSNFSGSDSFVYTVCDNGSPQLCNQGAVQLVIDDCPEATVTSIPATVCTNSLLSFSAIDQGTGVTYSWNFGPNATPQFATGISVSTTYNSPGSIPLTLTVTKGGCQDEYTTSISVLNGTFQANAGLDKSICQGESVSIGGSPTGPSGAMFTWTPADGLNSTFVANPVAYPTVTTTYTVEVNFGSCSITDQVTVVVADELIADAGPDQSNCGDGVQIGGSPTGASGSTYSWSPVFGLNDPTAANPISNHAASITYTVTVSKNGCVATDQVFVERSYPPNISAGDDQTLCVGASGQGALLGGPFNVPGISYSWSPVIGLSNPTEGNTFANPPLTTVYTLTATQDGCVTTDQVTVIVEECTTCIYVDLKVMLEGAIEVQNGLMSTNLNTSRGLLPGQTPKNNFTTPTPAGHPFGVAPWNHQGTEGQFYTDADYSNTVVDWVLISFRTGTAPSTEVSKTAALLNADGSVEFMDNCVIEVPNTVTGLYILVEHRNHLGIMSATAKPIVNGVITVDFTQEDSYKDSSFGQLEVSPGFFCMFGGDGNQADDVVSYDINGDDKIVYAIDNGQFNRYISGDYNLDGDVNGEDKILWNKNNGVTSKVYK